MKKKLILLITAGLLVAAAIVGGSLAATSASGQKATSDLAAPTLQVSVGQSASRALTLDAEDSVQMPGDQLAGAGFTIENTAEVPLYARVTVTKYWTDANAKNNTTKDSDLIHMSAQTGSWLQAQAIFAGTTDETEVYYYALPLQPGQTATLDLDIALDETLGNDYQSAGIVLEATVDAVQYVAGQNELNADGILATFGVVATLGGDGGIQSVTQ
ncbi:MAG: hypothetical protein VB055_10345 [Oscillospiraceae bacterium]|nr:hypothetical protein [Oscillospiraceae bacterium]